MIDEIVKWVSNEVHSDIPMVAMQALTILGHRLNIRISYGEGNVKPNLFTFICGASTLSRKSTSYKLLSHIYTVSDMEIGSRQALTAELRREVNVLVFHDEASDILKKMANDTRGDIRLAGFLNKLSVVTDNSVTDETTLAARQREGPDSNIIKSPKLSMILLTTPKSLRDVTSEELVNGGFFFRCLVRIPTASRLTLSDKRAWSSESVRRTIDINAFRARVGDASEDEWFVQESSEAISARLHVTDTNERVSDELEAYISRLSDSMVKCAAIKCVDRLIDAGVPPSSRVHDITRDDMEWVIRYVASPSLKSFSMLFGCVCQSKELTRINQLITDRVGIVNTPVRTTILKQSLRMDVTMFDKLLPSIVLFQGDMSVVMIEMNGHRIEHVCRSDDCEGCQYGESCVKVLTNDE